MKYPKLWLIGSVMLMFFGAAILDLRILWTSFTIAFVVICISADFN